MSLCYGTECDMIDRELFFIQSSTKTGKGRDIETNAQAWISLRQKLSSTTSLSTIKIKSSIFVMFGKLNMNSAGRMDNRWNRKLNTGMQCFPDN